MAANTDWSETLSVFAHRRKIAKWVLFAFLLYTVLTTALLILTVELDFSFSQVLLYLCPLTFIFTPTAFQSFASEFSAVLALLPLLGWVLLACKKYCGRYFILITYSVVLVLLTLVTAMFGMLSLGAWAQAYFQMTIYYAICPVVISVPVLVCVHIYQPKK